MTKTALEKADGDAHHITWLSIEEMRKVQEVWNDPENDLEEILLGDLEGDSFLYPDSDWKRYFEDARFI